ncbi:MAG TPA: hypothetical protein VN739_06630 [Nitrososphaerales archaeon]|nr:hypothetical protein [Nitrososphaerales archaeon]
MILHSNPSPQFDRIETGKSYDAQYSCCRYAPTALDAYRKPAALIITHIEDYDVIYPKMTRVGQEDLTKA